MGSSPRSLRVFGVVVNSPCILFAFNWILKLQQPHTLSQPRYFSTSKVTSPYPCLGGSQPSGQCWKRWFLLRMNWASLEEPCLPCQPQKKAKNTQQQSLSWEGREFTDLGTSHLCWMMCHSSSEKQRLGYSIFRCCHRLPRSKKLAVWYLNILESVCNWEGLWLILEGIYEIVLRCISRGVWLCEQRNRVDWVGFPEGSCPRFRKCYPGWRSRTADVLYQRPSTG